MAYNFKMEPDGELFNVLTVVDRPIRLVWQTPVKEQALVLVSVLNTMVQDVSVFMDSIGRG